mgnify:CR=1 FL=1
MNKFKLSKDVKETLIFFIKLTILGTVALMVAKTFNL